MSASDHVGVWLLLGGLLSGCSTASFVKTAYYGDLPTLKQEIRAASASGRLGDADVRELAVAVARREVRSAQGSDAIERIDTARSCVSAVEPELRERAETADDVGARAVLVLADAGRVRSKELVGTYARSESGAWRAVAARGTAAPEWAAWRRAFYVDPDERVRREALRAAFEAADPTEVDLLAETARLDPSPGNRSLATRAIGAIGGPRAAIALKDLWVSADPTLRLAIVEAWSLPRVYSSGGADELVALAETRKSLPSVAAAGALLGKSEAEAKLGRTVLYDALKQGTTDEKLLALQLVPLAAPESIAALDDAARSDDAVVRIAALTRLVEVPSRRRAALASLETTAASNDAAARQARLALANAEDPSAVTLLARDVSQSGPTLRASAAVALYRLGHSSKMAAALADSDPSVRMRVACSVAGPSPRGS